MSRRFGRNQKRAMREEINRVSTNLQLTEKKLKQAVSDYSHFEHALDYAIRVLGKYHIAFEPPQVQTTYQSDYIAIPKISSELPRGYDMGDSARVMNTLISKIELAIAKGTVRRDDITGDVHASVRFPDGTNGYAVSSVENLRYMPTEFLVEQMSRMIADGIVKCTERDRRY